MQDQPWLNKWEDYYDILGVDGPSADEKEIKRAYEYKVWTISEERLVGAPEHVRRKAEEELKKVNRAYHDVLKDPNKKREYDKEWKRKVGEGAPSGTDNTPPKPKPVADPETIRFLDIKRGEIRSGSFVIRNSGGLTPKSGSAILILG
jgi:curved DNA-binding protein CbpA